MSTSDPHADHSLVHAEQGHDAHEPTDELAPDEPHTPLWLTGVGIALLVSAGVGYLTMGPSDSAASDRVSGDEATEEQSPQPAAEPAVAASANRPSLRRMPPAAGGRNPTPNIRDLVPGVRPPRPAPSH